MGYHGEGQRRHWHPTPVLLPGQSHGWRSLVGCSPWGRSESDTTERLHFHFSLSCTGEGNGNPLQCSCLENPRDGGAWWAAVYGVAQSRKRLKWLSKAKESTFLTAHLKCFWAYAPSIHTCIHRLYIHLIIWKCGMIIKYPWWKGGVKDEMKNNQKEKSNFSPYTLRDVSI